MLNDLDAMLADRMAGATARHMAAPRMEEDNYPEHQTKRLETLIELLTLQPNPIYEQLCEDMDVRPDFLRQMSMERIELMDTFHNFNPETAVHTYTVTVL